MKKDCEHCGITEHLQEHHISYDPEEKITLCVTCHQKEHNGHGVGHGRGDYLLLNELKEEFIKLSENGKRARTWVAKQLGISYMTAYSWDNALGIKREVIYDKEEIKNIPEKVKMKAILGNKVRKKNRLHKELREIEVDIKLLTSKIEKAQKKQTSQGNIED